MTNLQQQLIAMQDRSYRDFMAKLCPTVDKDSIIGVRTPALRGLAKDMIYNGQADDFIGQLPHRYFEENQLHAFILSHAKDMATAIEQVNIFLPFVDNWATCDQLLLKVFARHKTDLLPAIQAWIQSEHIYTVRFGVSMLMRHFLDADFHPRYLQWVATIHSEEYYINMMNAWYFATALAKQYDATLPYFAEGKLEQWVHNKAIQKARESFRVSEEHKEALKILKRT